MSHSRIEELKIRAKLMVKESQKAGNPLSLGDALDEMAKKAGHKNWRELMKTLQSERYCPPYASSRLNHWFRNYEEAKEFLDKNPAMFLLPYRHQFFVCSEDYLEGTLQLEKDDADIVAVGNDWANPKNQCALEKLNRKLSKQN